MNLLIIALTILGLSLFEVITSIDNAVINAEVLSGMSKKGRGWFLGWGFLFAVFVVRGLLPFSIVYLANPQLGVFGVLTAAFTKDPRIIQAIHNSAPLLLLGGGVFLLFLFLQWLFVEPKSFGLKGEKFFQQQGVWFYAVISILLVEITWVALQKEPFLGFAAVVGSTLFFIIHGFRQYAEEQEKKLLSGEMSDLSKIAYLEVLDATFSLDGIIGAFAFTFSIPLILIGNGLGAFLLRRLTVGNIERIKKYKYLKNGAMYSILFLGIIMMLDSFGLKIPEWLSPLITFITVGWFFYKSHMELKTVGKVLEQR